MPSRWSALGSSGSGRPCRCRSRAASARSPSLSPPSSAVLDPHGFDHRLRARAWHAAPPRAPSGPRGACVSRCSIHQRAKAMSSTNPIRVRRARRRGDDRFGGAGSAEPLLDLPAGARPGPEEVARELERLLGVGCGTRLAGAGHRDQADAVSAGAVTSPIGDGRQAPAGCPPRSHRPWWGWP